MISLLASRVCSVFLRHHEVKVNHKKSSVRKSEYPFSSLSDAELSFIFIYFCYEPSQPDEQLQEKWKQKSNKVKPNCRNRFMDFYPWLLLWKFDLKLANHYYERINRTIIYLESEHPWPGVFYVLNKELLYVFRRSFTIAYRSPFVFMLLILNKKFEDLLTNSFCDWRLPRQYTRTYVGAWSRIKRID